MILDICNVNMERADQILHVARSESEDTRFHSILYRMLRGSGAKGYLLYQKVRGSRPRNR